MTSKADPRRVFLVVWLILGVIAVSFAAVTHVDIPDDHGAWVRNSPHFFFFVPVLLPLAGALLAAVLTPTRADLRRILWLPRRLDDIDRGWGCAVACLLVLVAAMLVSDRQQEAGTIDIWEVQHEEAFEVERCVRMTLAGKADQASGCRASRTVTDLESGCSGRERGSDAHDTCVREAYEAWVRREGTGSRFQLAIDLIGTLISIALFATAAQWLVRRPLARPRSVDLEILRLSYACAMMWFPLRLYALWHRNFHSFEALAAYNLFTAAAVLGLSIGLMLVLAGGRDGQRWSVDWSAVAGVLATSGTVLTQVFRPRFLEPVFEEAELYLQLASERGLFASGLIVLVTIASWGYALVNAKAHHLASEVEEDQLRRGAM